METNPNQIKDRFQTAVRRHLRYSSAKPAESAVAHDWLQAISLAVREFAIDGILRTQDRLNKNDAKRLYYLSIEFLMGRSLGSTLYNLGLYEVCREALMEMGVTGVFGPGTSTEEIIQSIRTAALEGPHADPLSLADADS